MLASDSISAVPCSLLCTLSPPALAGQGASAMCTEAPRRWTVNLARAVLRLLGPRPSQDRHHCRVRLPSGSCGPAVQLPSAPCRGRVVFNIFIRPGTRARANFGALSSLRTWDEDFFWGGLELKKKNTKFTKAIFFRMRREKPHQITNFEKLTNNHKQKWTWL